MSRHVVQPFSPEYLPKRNGSRLVSSVSADLLLIAKKLGPAPSVHRVQEPTVLQPQNEYFLAINRSNH